MESKKRLLIEMEEKIIDLENVIDSRDAQIRSLRAQVDDLSSENACFRRKMNGEVDLSSTRRAEKMSEDENQTMVDDLLNTIKSLQEENARLKRLMSTEGDWTLEQDNLGVVATIKHWGVKLIASSLVESLGDAENFVVMDIQHPTGVISVTVRREEGKTPSEVLGELRERIAVLEKTVKEVYSQIDAFYEEGYEYFSPFILNHIYYQLKGVLPK